MLKLISYRDKGLRQWGVLTRDETSVIPAADLEETYYLPLSETLDEFIEEGEEGLLTLAKLLNMRNEDSSIDSIPLSSVTIEVPFYPRRNVFCVGKNYHDHVREFEGHEDSEYPSVPVFFSKASTAVIGPEETIIRHCDITTETDYEGELAIVIGKRGSDIAEEEALEYIYGYTIVNDITARDLQRSHEQWFKGKSLDTYCPMGPSLLVSKENLSVSITTSVNGEARQQGKTEDFIFSIPKIISALSDGMTLLPGDVIATGTPKGVGMGFAPPRFLKSGDMVSITIPPIGTLKNPVK